MIPSYYKAYKTEDIEEWDADKILTHLAAIRQFMQRDNNETKEKMKAFMSLFTGKRR